MKRRSRQIIEILMDQLSALWLPLLQHWDTGTRGMKLTKLIRISIFLTLPALILSITSVIITGGYLQEIKALKAANAAHLNGLQANQDALQEMFTAQNRAVRQAIYEQNRDLAKQIDDQVMGRRPKKIKSAER
jgi:hypothetical protein